MSMLIRTLVLGGLLAAATPLLAADENQQDTTKPSEQPRIETPAETPTQGQSPYGHDEGASGNTAPERGAASDDDRRQGEGRPEEVD